MNVRARVDAIDWHGIVTALDDVSVGLTNTLLIRPAAISPEASSSWWSSGRVRSPGRRPPGSGGVRRTLGLVFHDAEQPQFGSIRSCDLPTDKDL